MKNDRHLNRTNRSSYSNDNDANINFRQLDTRIQTAYKDIDSLRKAIKDIKNVNQNMSTLPRSEILSRDGFNINLVSKTSSFLEYKNTQMNTNGNMLSPKSPHSPIKLNFASNITTPSKEIINKKATTNNYDGLYNYKRDTERQQTNYSFTSGGIGIDKDRFGTIKDNNMSIISNPMTPDSRYRDREMDRDRNYRDIKELPNYNTNNTNTNTNYTNMNSNRTNQHPIISKVTNSNPHTYVSKEDELESIKISNQILTKCNLDLKNENKLMKMELDSMKYDIDNGSHNASFDQNLAIYIENMKSTLNTTKENNIELNDIIELLQKKNAEITNENALYREQHEISQKNIEIINKKYYEVTLNLEEFVTDFQRLENENRYLVIQIEEKHSLILENNEKISNLLSLNETYNKYKLDTNEIIENLKNTIEIMRKANMDNEKEKTGLITKVERLQNELAQKNYEIEELDERLHNTGREKNYSGNEILFLRDELNKKDKYIEELQYNCKNLVYFIDKTKLTIETNHYNIEEKECTIDNLKKALNFVTKTFESYKSESDKFKDKNDFSVDKIKSCINNDYDRRLHDVDSLLEEMEKDKEELHKKNLLLENELNEKKVKLTQCQFEYEVLLGKYNEQTEAINKLKEENRGQKINKINEDYSINFIRNNDEKTRKMNDLTDELKKKNEQIEEIIKSYEEKVSSKDEKIRELTFKNNTSVNSTRLKEIEYINEVNNLKTENVELKVKVEKITDKYENEKNTLKVTQEKIQTDFESLINNINKIEEMNRNLKKELREKDTLIESLENKIRNMNRNNNNSSRNIRIDDINSFSLGGDSKEFDNNNNNINTNSAYSKLVYNNVTIKKKEIFISNQEDTEENKENKDTDNDNDNQIDNLFNTSGFDVDNEQTIIYTIYSNKKLLSFNSLTKEFTLINIDKDSDFITDYSYDNTIYLNTVDGLYIVTGKNTDIFYHFNNTNQTMIKLSKLSSSHIQGSLIYFQKSNSILCLSGKKNTKVEKYVNNEDLDFLNITGKRKILSNRSQWVFLPDMIHDRTGAGYIIINHKFIYALYGYSYKEDAYLTSIERLNLKRDFLGSNFQWEEVKYKQSEAFSLTYLKGFFCVCNEKANEIVIYGGINGHNDSNSEDVMMFNYLDNESKKMKKNKNRPLINACFTQNNFAPLLLDNDNRQGLFCIYDDQLTIHSIDNQGIKYNSHKFI